MKSHLSRRQFLATAGAAASVTLLGNPLFDSGAASAAAPLVRRDVGNMNTDDPTLLAYRRAIKMMQLLPVTDPLSWAYQAAIHGTTLSNNLTAWNTCEHGTDYFWSWHRMYLYWFERIIRKMCCEPCWALPYWNWALGSEFHLPAPFRDPTSELYTPNRNLAMNNGTGSLVPTTVDVSPAFSQPNFLSANSIIQGPHGSVHIETGGWMASVPTAAQDPVFYLHHANVDRLWNLWLAQGGGRTDPLSDNTWKTNKYTFFDENGNQVQMDACEVLRCAQQLNYVYEGEPPEVNEYCLRFIPPWQFTTEVVATLPIPPVELGPEPVTFPIELKDLRERLTSIAESKNETLFLDLDNIETETQPGVVWEVFVGLPPHAELDTKGPHYVGVIALFGTGVRDEAHHGFVPAHFKFPINRAIQAALKAKDERLTVTIAPVGILVDGKPSRPEVKSKVRIGKASLIVEHAKESEKKEND